MTSISVIVPFYNSEKYIARCIEALLEQEYPEEHYEIIFVNNNSADSSRDIIRRYTRVKLISEQKRGSYAARNSGLKEATGEIIAFTDSDCVPSRDWLKEIDSAMTSPETRILIGNCQLARESYLLSIMEDYENEKNNYVFTSGVKELYYGYTRNMAVRKSLFEEMGPFLERVRGSDTIFIRKYVDRYPIDTVRYCPSMQVSHLEIDSTYKYFRKLFTYGKSSIKYSQVVDVRPLTNCERYRVFHKISRNRGYSWYKTITLMCLLLIGFLYWIAGRLSCALASGKSASK